MTTANAPDDELRDFMAFLDAAPTPYHAARNVAERLDAAGFARLDEREAFSGGPGSRGYLLKGGTLLAFVAGTEAPWDSGFIALGAHTDSPNLRLKPNPDLNAHGYRQIAVEVYGGVLLTTWLDRDPASPGASLRRRAQRAGPAARRALPDSELAIHLNREVNKDGLQLNRRRISRRSGDSSATQARRSCSTGRGRPGNTPFSRGYGRGHRRLRSLPLRL